MTKLSVKAEFMQSTVQEKLVGIARLKIEDQWIELLRSYLKEHKATYFRITLEPWGTATERSINFFHEIRDRICEAMGDSSRDHKEHMKKTIKEKYGPMEGERLKSMSKYTTQEMKNVIDGALLMAEEAEADIRDLIPEWRENAKALKK